MTLVVILLLFMLATVFLYVAWRDEVAAVQYWKDEARHYQKLWDDLRNDYNTLRRETEEGEEWKM